MSDLPLQPPPGSSRRALFVRVFLLSFALLFLELLLIRWVPSRVRAISYYKNLLLMASFLGLGMGCLLARRRVSVGWLFPVGLAAVIGAAFFFAEQKVAPDHSQETLIWVLYFDLSADTRRFGVEWVSAIFFVLGALPFIGLGQALGRSLAQLPALPGYLVNLVASLAGSLAYTALCAGSLPPTAWFGLLAVVGVLAFLERPFEAVLTAAVLAGALVPIARADRDSIWSPYYKIDRVKTDLGFSLSVNNSFHQHALDLQDRRSDKIAQLFQRYAIWSDFKAAPARVLVLGAGTGNDVAVALAKGAREIDAVEIDPVILDLGVTDHPAHPYQSPRVSRHVQDARRFLRATDRTYDLIVFGTLDSQTLLSGMAAIRLDSYMYTRECFESVRDRLAPDGVMALYYSAGETWLVDKMQATIRDGFGYTPLKILPPPIPGLNLFSAVFLAGEPIRHRFAEELARQARGLPSDVHVPSDDWPNLYLKAPGLPGIYRTPLAAILVLSALGVFACLPAGARRIRGFYFLMGAGFLLVETRAISELALLFGSTWVVTAFVISTILALLIVVTALTLGGPAWSTASGTRRAAPVALLVGSVVLAGVFPPSAAFAVLPAGSGALAAIVLALAPVAGAAWLYGWVYREETAPEQAFGSNLLGAMVGGATEYLAMWSGNRALAWVALVCYAGAVCLALRRRA